MSRPRQPFRWTRGDGREVTRHKFKCDCGKWVSVVVDGGGCSCGARYNLFGQRLRPDAPTFPEY